MAGSGKKPWRQKGTGNARSGYKSSPVWSGGGVVFGPHPRDYSKKTNKAVKQLALKKALSERIGAGEVFLLDVCFTLEKPKTKDLLAKLSVAQLEKKVSALIVLENADQNLYLASPQSSRPVGNHHGRRRQRRAVAPLRPRPHHRWRVLASSPPGSRNNAMTTLAQIPPR